MATNIVRHARTKRWIALLAFALLLTSCDYQAERDSSLQLGKAAQRMEANPKEAQQLLEGVIAEDLSEYDYAYYLLLRARLAAMNGANIAPMEEAVARSTDYFASRDDAAQAAFGCFVLAKVYEAKQSPTKALHYYLLADDWAAKVRNRIPNFLYSTIPYNIASYYKRDGYFEISLQYLEKTLEYIAVEDCGYLRKVYSLELIGLNYKNLSKPQEALNYYDKAMQIATQNNDTTCINRILYNKHVLLNSTNDNQLAEEECRYLMNNTLPQSKDSIYNGLLYLSLAKIYANTNRVDSAAVIIVKSAKLLKGAEANIQGLLFETQSLVEQKKGNLAKAAAYQQQYNSYKAGLERKRQADREELAALEKAGRERGEYLAKSVEYTDASRVYRKKDALKWWLVFIAALTTAGPIYWLLSFRKIAKQLLNGVKDTSLADFCTDELLRYAQRAKGMLLVMEGVRSLKTDEQVGRVAYMLDELVPPDSFSWYRLSPTPSCSYGELVGLLRGDFPQLSKQQLEALALQCSQRIGADNVAAIVGLTPQELREQEREAKRKLRSAGYSLRDVRQRVKSYLG